MVVIDFASAITVMSAQIEVKWLKTVSIGGCDRLFPQIVFLLGSSGRAGYEARLRRGVTNF